MVPERQQVRRGLNDADLGFDAVKNYCFDVRHCF